MAETTLENVYEWKGAVLNLSGSAGATRNGTLAVSSFADMRSGDLIVDDADGGRDWDTGETATFDGAAATLTGTGTISAGVNLLGINVSLGSSAPINVFSAGGSTFVQYPEGDQASLLDGLASQILATPSLSFTLGLLGLDASNLVTYLEQNAVLSYNITLGAPISFCFTVGTLIETNSGDRPIEDLCVGDMVRTLDHGFQPIRWIGRRSLIATGRIAPVRISQGALGNRRTMEVSPQHRMLVTSWQAELLFGEHEVLVPAVHLVNGDTITQRRGGMVDYVHMLFDRHEIVFAEGVPSESFHPGDMTQRSLSEGALEEIHSIFPELRNGTVTGRTQLARRSLKRYEAQALSPWR